MNPKTVEDVIKKLRLLADDLEEEFYEPKQVRALPWIWDTLMNIREHYWGRP